MLITNNPKQFIAIAQKAGDTILKVYQTDFEVEIKPDNSPVTIADKQSDAIITAELQKLYPDIPVMSEEGTIPDYEDRKHWSTFWSVDPLDGTKEFIKKTDEFTINIALIENNTPVFGLIYAPALKLLYYGGPDMGAFKVNYNQASPEPKQLFPNQEGEQDIAIAVSRSYRSKAIDAYCETLEKQGKVMTLIQAGSALKFGYLAEGKVDRYPRFGPTMEWDTAAGHAIALAVGKQVYIQGSGEVLTYNRPDLRNPDFICQ